MFHTRQTHRFPTLPYGLKLFPGSGQDKLVWDRLSSKQIYQIRSLVVYPKASKSIKGMVCD